MEGGEGSEPSSRACPRSFGVSAAPNAAAVVCRADPEQEETISLGSGGDAVQDRRR